MANDLTPELLTRSLTWIFDRVAAPTATPARLTERELDSAILKYTAAAGAAGFVTNLGGVLTLPVTLPANLVGVAAIQLRLIAAIAAARGHDTSSDAVRTLGIACLTGRAALDILKGAGIRAGMRLGERAVGQLSAAALAQVNQRVGAQLLAKAGAAGAVNLAKAVPLIGGLIGGGFDAAGTRAVAAVAKRVFPPLPAITIEAPGPALAAPVA